MEKVYEVIISEETDNFLKQLEEPARIKFTKAFDKVELNQISENYFKKLPGTDGIWEFRVQHMGHWYRILAFLARIDGKPKVITTHGFIKKGNKTPKKEIDKAEGFKRKNY